MQNESNCLKDGYLNQIRQLKEQSLTNQDLVQIRNQNYNLNKQMLQQKKEMQIQTQNYIVEQKKSVEMNQSLNSKNFELNKKLQQQEGQIQQYQQQISNLGKYNQEYKKEILKYIGQLEEKGNSIKQLNKLIDDKQIQQQQKLELQFQEYEILYKENRIYEQEINNINGHNQQLNTKIVDLENQILVHI